MLKYKVSPKSNVIQESFIEDVECGDMTEAVAAYLLHNKKAFNDYQDSVEYLKRLSSE